MTIKIGHGYDVHRLTENRKLILGGIEIPFEKGLYGHSDADVLVHALMDAILGSLAMGDIGKLFPDNDLAYDGVDSIELLKRVYGIAEEKGFILGNCDITILAQRPKLRPYIDDMRACVAKAMHTDIDNVSIKATTEEKLGFTGAELGIAAHAVVLMLKK